ncbi:hypothetical protein [Simiduia agarivorans]|uniref:Uncharacterized protein n=1 Tax=Simiduia agarivorans (strain DSM 21679 / JCM 13881 / BCRC 17597 / SA1) TaxID=1117647 RepID=R9S604_SIMAS|nr:hypothetical protein [Simiduia agarivorans]AGN11298.1 hypothetical protein M5M_05833 [Simiduia agarivorans SA1 = DSM 21679]
MADSDASMMELVGQRIPVNVWSALIVLILSVLIFSLEKCTVGGVKNVVQAGLLGENVVESTDSLILTFWTPSERTWAEMSDGEKERLVKDGRADWYQTTNDILASFGDQLVNGNGLSAQGFSRWESFGKGTSASKWGWTWSVSIARKNVGADVGIIKNKFRDIYTKNFIRDQDIYLEIRHAEAIRDR